MKKFTLKDFGKTKEGKYYFPEDGYPEYGKEAAENLLVICNYTGEFTPVMTTSAFAKVVKDIIYLKNKTTNLPY